MRKVQIEDFVQPSAPHLDWMSFRGDVLDGGYQLGDMIAADSQFAAFRVRVLGDTSLDAVAQFYSCDPDKADEQIAVWKTVRELAHSHLHTPLAAGKKNVNGWATVYVVLKRVEERLSGALEERALRPAEAGELLTSLLSALQALHGRGLVHGCISPEHVLATESAILLSTECVRRVGLKSELEAIQPKYVAPESTVQNLTPEADLWCLGATLFEALTRSECGNLWRDEATGLPQPFRRVVQRCLEIDPQNRGTLPEIAGIYASREATMAKPAAEPAKAPVELPRPVEGVASPVLVSAPKRPAARPASSAAAKDKDTRVWRGWLYGAIAVLIAIAIISIVRTRHRPVSQRGMPAVVPLKPDHKSPVAQGNTAWPTQTLSPDSGARSQQAASTPQTPPPASSPVAATRPQQHTYINGPIWRVVLYTYVREQDAQAKARDLNQKYPELKAEAFSPSGNGAPYLVVAGGQMDRDAAVQLRRQVLRMGLPHDTYIQNFRH